MPCSAWEKTLERRESGSQLALPGGAQKARPEAVEAPGTNGQGHGAPPAARSRRRLIALAVLVPALAIAAVFLAHWLAYSRTHQSTDDAAVDGDLYPVSAKITGRVTNVRVSGNQFVHRGQLLVDLDRADLQAQLAQAKAMLAMEEASAQAARTGVTITQQTTSSATGQAQAGLGAARAQDKAAREQVRVGSAQIASAEAALQAARQGVMDALNNVRSAQAQVVSSRAALAAAEEGVSAAKQAVAGAQAGAAAAPQLRHAAVAPAQRPVGS